MQKLLVLFLFCCPVLLRGQDTGYVKKLFIRQGDTLRYRMLYPDAYNKKKSYPVITVLHGSGERGSNNEAQLLHGGSLFQQEDLRKRFPSFVIFPQCPADSAWNVFTRHPDSTGIAGWMPEVHVADRPTRPALLVKALLDSLVGAKAATANQMYIGGLSLGGFGTFDMIERYPRFFAAAFPICGGGDTSAAHQFAKTVSVWIFHGDSDRTVDVRNSRNYYTVLKSRGADVKYTEYPGVGHNSWDNAFAEADLLPWLFSKRRQLKGNR